MIQLVAEGVFLDLYENDPPKVTLQFDSTETFQPQASYTQQFRVPSTDNNYNFFKTAFEVNGYDFDVTQRKAAQILVDGSQFASGEIRLTKIYNTGYESYEYELVFLGDTRSLTSRLGNKLVGELDMSDLHHEITMTNVVNSWSAYPSSANLTGGIFQGNVVYPLVDFGNTYDDNESVNEVSISVGSNQHITQGNPFIVPITSRISADRFKPIVRLKYVLDKIFEEANCTYVSNFLGDFGETPGHLPFYRMYMTAWGNTETIFTNPDIGLARVLATQEVAYTGAANIVQFDAVDVDYNSTWNASTNRFTIQPLGGSTYLIKVRIQGTADNAGNDNNIKGFIRLNNQFNLAYHQGYTISNPGGDVYYYYGQVEIDLEEGDFIQAGVDCLNGSQFNVISGQFSMESTVTTVYPETLIRNDYKQIDFIRDLVSMFKLVVIPNKDFPNKYKIEPWASYVASGEVKDWTQKIDIGKDIEIEPLFNEQKSQINFSYKREKDWLNDLNDKFLKETFGTLKFYTDNDLLEGEKKVELNVAPTPVREINGANQNPGGNAGEGMDNMIIPHIYTLEPGNTRGLKRPIVPTTRFVYYNGLKNTGSDSSLQNNWYWVNDVNSGQESTFYPQITPYQYMPYPYESGGNSDIFGSDLNWQVENGYLQYQSLGPRNSIYDLYWRKYIELIYGKYSRRITANFHLSDNDVMSLEFSDVIFIKDAYYFVEQIQNYMVGDENTTKVKLIKLNDYYPPQGGFIPPFTGLVWEEINVNWEDITDNWGAF